MIYGTCDGCKIYTVTEPLAKLHSDYYRINIFLCNDCMNGPDLDPEIVAENEQ